MYHELEAAGRSLCQAEAGYLRYVLKAADFQAQMDALKRMGRRGTDVSEALTFPSSSVAITFDDGCETDLLFAAPLLKGANFGATFFVTTGFLGKRGYLSRIQLRELSDLGFEVGCHSMTHPYLSDLALNALHEEIAVPKAQLEEITGRSVKHFSCPGGRWNRQVAQTAREAGYESVSTSRNFANSDKSDRYCLGRVAVMRDMGLESFKRICRAEGLWRLQLRDLARAGGKRLIGNSGYDALRALLLRDNKTSRNSAG
jgi:peptidoglycan/xylan/chitin deacetylase (PgdA/CDA1 family)